MPLLRLCSAVEIMQGKIAAYEGLLQYLAPQLDSAGQLAVQKAMAEVSNPCLLCAYPASEPLETEIQRAKV